MTSHLADFYQNQIELVAGDGCYLWDKNGKRYLDFIAGWCVGNIGWRRQEVIADVKQEAERGLYAPPWLRSREQEQFAQELCDIAPNKKLTRAFRCTSGSEAVEFAVKCARAATGKPTIVTIEGVYHGHTYAAASAGDACTREMAPCAPGFLKLPMPNAYRGVESETVIRQFERLLSSRNDIAGFMSEPVWTNAGVIIPPDDFYPAIAELCRKRGALLIMDEVATGFGRCGKLFASELWDLKPDILCLGKGLTGGYGTLGATLVTESIFKASRHIPSYSTFGWLALDLAAARANVKIILKEKVWKNAERTGTELLQRLKPLERLPQIGQARGIGLAIGIEIVRDKKSKASDLARSQRLQDACAEAGLLIETAHHTLFLTPPLILTPTQAEDWARILEKILMD